ncbi:hypothetical protein NT95_07950 [Oenococcus kitaharae]|nr:hypothetical protein NT95_07950 [Oenococcus kitaharae]OEY82921.1 hypothetical protein NV75_06050 [Oenococcus kitaharae]OEY84535.1 hypothetical protein NT96_04585 [Oenococcus kitaharae]
MQANVRGEMNMAGDWLVRTVYGKHQTEWPSLPGTPLEAAHTLCFRWLARLVFGNKTSKAGW